MPSYIIRASTEPDSPYLIWSTIVDAPTYVFSSRAEVLEHLLAEQGKAAYERLARADEQGSSAIYPAGAFGWTDASFIVMNGVPKEPENVWWELPRERLADYARAYLDDNESAAMALLVSHPYEDDEGEVTA